jgi:hypothetical protein
VFDKILEPKLRKITALQGRDITVVSELVILPACEGIQAWIWKTIKTMQGTMEPVVQRHNEQGIKVSKSMMRSLHIV